MALEAVLYSHTPKNLPKRKSHSGRKVPNGASHFNPISTEWRDILDPPEMTTMTAKKGKLPATATQKRAAKKKATQKIATKKTAAKKTTPK